MLSTLLVLKTKILGEDVSVQPSELYIDWNDNSGGILKPNMGTAMQVAPVPFRKMASKKIG